MLSHLKSSKVQKFLVFKLKFKSKFNFAFLKFARFKFAFLCSLKVLSSTLHFWKMFYLVFLANVFAFVLSVVQMTSVGFALFVLAAINSGFIFRSPRHRFVFLQSSHGLWCSSSFWNMVFKFILKHFITNWGFTVKSSLKGCKCLGL